MGRESPTSFLFRCFPSHTLHPYLPISPSLSPLPFGSAHCYRAALINESFGEEGEVGRAGRQGTLAPTPPRRRSPGLDTRRSVCNERE
ncbi:hypothetical protein E2C01_037635 [Portunus trituberculatus]|uniref:Uncharacterized protein n=1 Tax=Portunus trituberculatus TaxID=210409 RepID=A0A5B7FF45_PORTR|nr:hypothetical protein [Portunus trituberculatus]